MIILGIIATLATFVFITALIFIFFEKTKKIGKQIAPLSLVLALCLFFIMVTLNRDSHKSKNADVTAATESKPVNSEDEGDSYVQSVEDTQKEFNFSLDEFVQTYNETVQDIENNDLSLINKDDIGDFKLTEVKGDTIYTRELKTKDDESGGIFQLEAWYDDKQNFNCLHLTTFGSDNMASPIGLANIFAVFQTLGIDIGHIYDLLKSDEEMLNVLDGDYSVSLAKIPSISLIINIEPK